MSCEKLPRRSKDILCVCTFVLANNSAAAASVDVVVAIIYLQLRAVQSSCFGIA